MTEPRLHVDLTGPFFEARDPGLTIRENLGRMLEGIAAEGEAAIRETFPVGGSDDPHAGAGRKGVIGRVQSLTGRRWALHAVISAQYTYPWPRTGRGGSHLRSGRRLVANTGEAQYRGGKLERRLHMFGNAAKALNASKAVAGANLTKGLE